MECYIYILVHKIKAVESELERNRIEFIYFFQIVIGIERNQPSGFRIIRAGLRSCDVRGKWILCPRPPPPPPKTFYQMVQVV